MKILQFIKALIEELWQVLVILWNLPVGIIEMAWLAIFDRERFKYNWGLLKQTIRGEGTEKNDGGIS